MKVGVVVVSTLALDESGAAGYHDKKGYRKCSDRNQITMTFNIILIVRRT